MKFLQSSKCCPQCGLKIHETQPLLNLKPDRVMQDVVFKLVPGLYESMQFLSFCIDSSLCEFLCTSDVSSCYIQIDAWFLMISVAEEKRRQEFFRARGLLREQKEGSSSHTLLLFVKLPTYHLHAMWFGYCDSSSQDYGLDCLTL